MFLNQMRIQPIFENISAMEKLPNEILQKILHHIKTPGDIVSCRLASRKWTAFATESLQRHHPFLHFDNEKKVADFHVTMDGQLDFLDFPFTKFSILLSSFQTFHIVKSLTEVHGRHMRELILSFTELAVGKREFDIFQSILSALSFTPNITHLELKLNIPRLVTREQGLQLVQVMPHSFPKLEVLRVSCALEGSDEGQSAWNHVLLAFRTAAPNIQEVVLCPPPTGSANFVKLLPSIVIFRTVPSMHVADELGLTTVQLLELRKFLPKPFMLSELRTCLIRLEEEEERTPGFDMETSRAAFHDWMKTQAQTLRKLEIRAGTGISDYRLPALQFLESLKLQGVREDYRPQTPFAPFRARDFPKLKNVSLKLWTEQMWCFGDEPFPTVETLTIAFFNLDFEYLTLRLHSIFPSIKTLELHTRGRQLKYFMKSFTHVRHLMLNFMEEAEPMFGDPNERQISQILEGSLNERNPPSLAMFRKLESLEVRGSYWVIKTIVNETKARHLKSLNRLTLNCKNDIMVVDKRVLKSVHKEVTWI